MKGTLKKWMAIVLSMLMLIGNLACNFPETVKAAGSTWVQGAGYQAGAYDTTAQQPSTYNWTRQSKYKGPDAPGIKWSLSTGGVIAYSSAAIGTDGTVYIGSADKNLYAINPDGTSKWSLTLGGSLSYGSPSIGADGTIYTSAGDNSVYAINSNGTLKWKYTLGGSVLSAPVIGGDGTIYIGSQGDYKLYAINPDGTLKWSYSTGMWIYGSPAVGADGTIYIAATLKGLFAINPDGTEKWRNTSFEPSQVSPVISSDGTIYVGFSDGSNYGLKAINPDGSQKWSYDQIGNTVYGSPAIGTDGTVYVSSLNGKITAIDSNGTLKWAYSAGSTVYSSPIVDSEGTIYFGSDDKKLYALNSDGSLKWSFTLGGSVRSSPSISAEGILYIGSNDYKVYALSDYSQQFADATAAVTQAETNRIQADITTARALVNALPAGTVRNSLNDRLNLLTVLLGGWQQGTGYQAGAYDLTAQKPTTYNWTRQSQYSSSGVPIKQWTFQTGAVGQIYSSPAIASDGTIYFGSGDKNFYALNPNGSLKWSYTTTTSVSSSAAIASDGTIYFGSTDKKLYAINPDGSLKWSYTTSGFIDKSSPAIAADGTIYIGTLDNKLYAINPNGSLKWSYMVGDYIFSSPAIATDGTIYFGSWDKKLYALNPDGSLKWSYLTGWRIDESSPAIAADGTVYVGSTDNKLYAINPDGSLKWSYTTTNAIYSSPAIGSDGIVYIGSTDKKLYAINPDGSLKWSYTTTNAIYTSPVIGSDGIVYIGSTDKKLYAINPDGSLKWSFSTGAAIYSSPAIASDGTIYFGSHDNYFYAIKDGLADAVTAVTNAENVRTQESVDSAFILVNALATSSEKTELTTRLGVVQNEINESIATTAVTQAETSRQQTDIDTARTLVNALSAGISKDTLITRLDTLEQSIAAQQLAAATAAVTQAETSRLQADITTARTLVNALPAGTSKDALGSRLDTLEQSIADDLAAATAAVIQAETSRIQADIITARTLVNALPEGASKDALSTRLDILEQSIADEKQLADATAAVVQAEASRQQSDIDTARGLVNTVSDAPSKDALSIRLLVLEANIADDVAKASGTVYNAETSRQQADITTARGMVNALPAGTAKDGLNSRLDALEQSIAAEQLIAATAAVTQAETSRLQADITTARGLVNALPAGTSKDGLVTRLDTLEQSIAEEQQLANATAAVTQAETSRQQADITTARGLVNALPAGISKDTLITRLDTLEQSITAQQLADATAAVIQAETNRLQADITTARGLVNVLPAGTSKDGLVTRLDTLEQSIAEEQQLANATAAVVQAETSRQQADITTARGLVNALPAGTSKDGLVTRLDTLEQSITAQQLADATAAVVQAETSRQQADITTARTLVNALPVGPSKNNLASRLNTLEQSMSIPDNDPEIVIPDNMSVIKDKLNNVDGAVQDIQDNLANVFDQLATKETSLEKILEDLKALAQDIDAAQLNLTGVKTDTADWKDNSYTNPVLSEISNKNQTVSNLSQQYEAAYQSVDTLSKVEAITKTTGYDIPETQAKLDGIENFTKLLPTMIASVVMDRKAILQLAIDAEKKNQDSLSDAEQKAQNSVQAAEDYTGSPKVALELINAAQTNVTLLPASSSLKPGLQTRLDDLKNALKMKVTRLWGTTAYDTTLEIAKDTMSKLNISKLDTIVLATGDTWQDSLTGSVLAGILETPLLIIPTNMSAPDAYKVLEFIKNNARQGATVYLLGGKAVLGDDYEKWFTQNGYLVNRLWGQTAADTAVEIAKEIYKVHNNASDEVFLVTDLSYADALSISAIAIKKQAPILLVNKNGITKGLSNALLSFKSQTIYTIGGNYVIPEVLFNQMSYYAQKVQRVGGVTLYDTNKEIFKAFISPDETYYFTFASGENYPDALTGSIHTAVENGFMFLVPKNLNDSEKNTFLNLYAAGLTFYGGNAVLSDQVENEILGLFH